MALNETGFYGESSGWADIEKFIQDQEATRQINEQARIQNEIARMASEAENDESEASRVSAESSRSAAEVARVQAEDARVQAEDARVQAEVARVQAEVARVQAETSRSDSFESSMATWQSGVDSLLATGGTYEARISALEAIENTREMTYEQIQAVVRAGVSSRYFKVGDQILVPWTDTASGTQYAIPFDVVHHADGSDDDHAKVTLAFDYQSDRHCSKTRLEVTGDMGCLTTSQIVTAPKPT